MLTFLVSTAMAAGFAGMGMPVLGGGLAGPAEVGAAGMFVNPAATLTARPELLLDVSVIRTQVSATLEGEERVSSTSASPVPSLSATVPVRHGSLGVAAFVPFARTGSNPPDSPVRFHSIDGGLLAFEVDGILAGEIADGVVLGLALRGAYIELESFKSVDTGALVSGLSEDELNLEGYDFLEGSQRLSDPQGFGGGFAAGLQAELEGGWMIAAYYRSHLWGQVRNQLAYTPSNDLTVEIQSTMTTRFRLPQQAGAAVEVPFERLRLRPELGFEGWESWRRFESRPTDVQVGSSDPILDEILAGAGIAAEDLVSDPEVTINGTRSIFWGGLGARYAIDPDWTLITGAWWVPAAIPDHRVHPGNVDYASFDLRLGVRWRSLTVTGDTFLIPSRDITRSSWGTDPGTAGSTPSGVGSYALRGVRVGMTFIHRGR